MNQDAPSPSFELPAPVSETGETTGAPYESVPSRPELAPAPAPVPAQTPAPASSAPSAPQSLPSQTVPVPVQAATTPVSADDHDLIEKEWVVKAKQIVAATKDDPYLQNRELNKFKADYLKKRYNKNLKLEESQGGV